MSITVLTPIQIQTPHSLWKTSLGARTKQSDKGVFLVVRFWSRSVGEIQELLDRLMTYNNSHLNILGYVFVINSLEDSGETAHILEQATLKYTMSHFFIIEHDSYSWTRANNTALEFIKKCCQVNGWNYPDIGVFFHSFDVQLSKMEADKIWKYFVRGNILPTVRMEKELPSPEQISREMQEYITSIAQGPVHMLPNYLAYLRNTCLLYPLDIVLSLGGFNPICDTGNETIGYLHGMEDIEFFRRLLKSSYMKRLVSDGEFAVYSDPRWDSISTEVKSKKKIREMITVCKILEGKVDNFGVLK